MENMSFGQNRMGICREGNQNQLKGSRAQEKEEDFKTPKEVLCHFLCSKRVMICD
jgi:hypothetical protein